MSLNRSERGVTLLELLIVVVMVSSIMVGLTMILSKSSINLTNNRRRWLANTLVAGRLQELKSSPYPLIALSSASATYFPVSGTGADGCSCGKENMSTLPVDRTYVDNNVTYVITVCTNLVDRQGGAWTSYCPDDPLTSATDKGLKNIRVRVTWQAGNNSYFTDMESMVAR